MNENFALKQLKSFLLIQELCKISRGVNVQMYHNNVSYVHISYKILDEKALEFFKRLLRKENVKKLCMMANIFVGGRYKNKKMIKIKSQKRQWLTHFFIK